MKVKVLVFCHLAQTKSSASVGRIFQYPTQANRSRSRVNLLVTVQSSPGCVHTAAASPELSRLSPDRWSLAGESVGFKGDSLRCEWLLGGSDSSQAPAPEAADQLRPPPAAEHDQSPFSVG